MSATNRGSVRRSKDNYPTPPWATNSLLGMVEERGGFGRLGAGSGGCGERLRLMDPCCGTGAILKTIAGRGGEERFLLRGVEIDKARKDHCAKEFQDVPTVKIEQGDFLSWEAERSLVDVIVTNPPYSLTLPFIEKSLKVASQVWMLLSLGILETPGRTAFLKRYLKEVWVFPNRISFVKSLKGSSTDSSVYGWFRFSRLVSGAPRLDWLPAVEGKRERWSEPVFEEDEDVGEEASGEEASA